MEQTKLWTKNFLLGTGINFLLVLNYYLLMVIMTEYSTVQYHASSSAAGLSSSMFAIGALLARFVSAPLMAKTGRKKMLLSGAVLEVAASLLYFCAADIYIMFCIRLFHGLSYGIASTAVSTIVTGNVPEKRHGEGIGYFMLSVTVGAAIGPFFGMFLIGHGGYPCIFEICAATAVLCCAGSALLPSPEEETEKRTLVSNQEQKAVRVERTESTAERPHGLERIFEKRAVPISIVCAGIYFCYSGILSFLTPYAEQTHLQTAASFFFIVYSAVILLTRPFTGRFFDRKGERFIMLPAFVSFFIGMLLLSRTHGSILLLVSAAFVGFGIGAIQSCGLALAVKNSPEERVGYVNSTFYIFVDLATGLGPFLLGFLIPAAGYRGLYLILAGVTVLFGILYLAVSGKSRKRTERE